MSRRYHDILDGDLSEFEYHQDYKGEDPWAYLLRPGVVLSVLLVMATITYHSLYLADYNLLSLPELLWNILVFLTPSRLIDAAELYTSPLRMAPGLKPPRTHASKAESMRRLLGLGTARGIIGLAQAGRKRISTLSGVNLVSEELRDTPAGLGNWDNSCYQNSVLQGLASLDSLSRYLKNPYIEGLDGIATRPDMRMAEALQGLIASLNDSTNNGKRIWTPASLKSMSSWQQQDAQEYFSKVLDEVDKEVGTAAGIMRKLQGFEADASSIMSLRDSERLRNSAYRNPLEGLVAQRVGCTSCGYSEGLSMIPFNCLTVPLGRAWEYDVSECLDEYTKLEAIEGVECGKCSLLKLHRQLSIILDRMKDSPDNDQMRQISERLRATTEALEDDDFEDKTLTQKCKLPSKNRVSSTKTRQAVVARPPKSLVVHFNRSQFNEMTGDLTKNYATVKFPKVLDLGPWCLGSSGTTQDVITEEWLLQPDQPMISSSRKPSRLRGPLYELRAVVTHYGRHENGHYICYKRHPGLVTDAGDPGKEQWWRLSDDDVSKVTEEDVLNQGGVFMLFFDLVAPAQIAPPQHLSTDPTITSELGIASLSSQTKSDVSEGVCEPDQVPLLRSPQLEHTLSDSIGIEYKKSCVLEKEESVETSTSEVDDNENNDPQQQDYAPTKAIIVPPYIKDSGVQDSVDQNFSKSSLVMV